MKSRLTKIFIACSAVIAMSACSSTPMMIAQDSLVHPSGDIVEAHVPSTVTKIDEKKVFITERAVDSKESQDKKADDDLTVKDMLAALHANSEKKSVTLEDNFHVILLNIQKQYNENIDNIDLFEYESLKHSVNIGILKTEAEIDKASEDNSSQCPAVNGAVGVSPASLISTDDNSKDDGSTEDASACDDLSDHLDSLRNDLSRLKIELKSTNARERLFEYQEKLRIEKDVLRKRTASQKQYQIDQANLKIDNDTSVMLVNRMHDVDSKFVPSIKSAGDKVDMYQKQLDQLDDYSDDDF